MHAQCLDAGPHCSRRVNTFGSGTRGFGYVGNRGVHCEIGWVINKVANRLGVFHGRDTLRSRCFPKTLGNSARRCGCQERSLQGPKLVMERMIEGRYGQGVGMKFKEKGEDKRLLLDQSQWNHLESQASRDKTHHVNDDTESIITALHHWLTTCTSINP